MGAALLQSNHANVTAGATSLNIAFLSAVTPGSLLVCYAGSTAATRTFTASDGVNGSYNNDIASNGGAGSCAILTFPNTASGTPTITLTISGAGTEIDAIIEEWSGVQTVTPLDKTVASSGATVTTGTGGTTATLSQTNELCISMLHLNGAGGTTTPFAAQSPFTPSPSSPWPSGNGNLTAAGSLLQSTTAAVTCTFNWTNTLNYRSCTATYKTVQLGQLAPLYSRKYVLFNT